MTQRKRRPTTYPLTISDAARILGYNEQYLRTLARANVITGIKRGTRWFFSREAVEAMFVTKEQRASL